MIYNRVKDYLEKEPRARERKLHKRAMVNILLEDYQALKNVQKETLIDFCNDFENATRAWRKVTEENPSLRGTDYNEKDELVKLKQQELGYE